MMIHDMMMDDDEIYDMYWEQIPQELSPKQLTKYETWYPKWLVSMISGWNIFFVHIWDSRNMPLFSGAFGFLLASLHFGAFNVRVPSAVSVVWMAIVGSVLAVYWKCKLLGQSQGEKLKICDCLGRLGGENVPTLSYRVYRNPMKKESLKERARIQWKVIRVFKLLLR